MAVDALAARINSPESTINSEGTPSAVEGRMRSESDASDPNTHPEPLEVKRARRRRYPLRAGLMIAVLLAGVVSWLGYQMYQTAALERQRDLFVQAASQGARNLSTINPTQIDIDIQRITDSATGVFLDDFQLRAHHFAAVVKEAQSTSVGTVTEAAVESERGDQATVLVAVTVATSTAAKPQPQNRVWRMRIDVQRVANEAKIAKVEFVQ